MNITFVKRPQYNQENDKTTIEVNNEEAISLEEFVDTFITFASACGWSMEAIVDSLSDKITIPRVDGLY